MYYIYIYKLINNSFKYIKNLFKKLPKYFLRTFIRNSNSITITFFTN